jgi:hypothetical protein
VDAQSAMGRNLVDACDGNEGHHTLPSRSG